MSRALDMSRDPAFRTGRNNLLTYTSNNALPSGTFKLQVEIGRFDNVADVKFDCSRRSEVQTEGTCARRWMFGITTVA
jgi:hypothetical protein